MSISILNTTFPGLQSSRHNNNSPSSITKKIPIFDSISPTNIKNRALAKDHILYDDDNLYLHEIKIDELVINSPELSKKSMIINENNYYGNVITSTQNEIKKDLPHGYGVLIFKDDYPSHFKKYEGQFQFGRMTGKGILEYQNGTTYVGEFKNGIADGIGEYCEVNAANNNEILKIYHGEWIQNNFVNGLLIDVKKNEMSFGKRIKSELSGKCFYYFKIDDITFKIEGDFSKNKSSNLSVFQMPGSINPLEKHQISDELKEKLKCFSKPKSSEAVPLKQLKRTFNTMTTNNSVSNTMKFEPKKSLKKHKKIPVSDENLPNNVLVVLQYFQLSYRGSKNKQNQPHGQGEMILQNGAICNGTFENGKFVNGSYIDINGDIYSGTFNEFNLQGIDCSHQFSSNVMINDIETKIKFKYTGSYENDLACGNGNYEFELQGEKFHFKLNFQNSILNEKLPVHLFNQSNTINIENNLTILLDFLYAFHPNLYNVIKNIFEFKK